MKLLITGGAGFIGSAVASALATSGNQVIVYDKVAPAKMVADIKYVRGDVLDADQLTTAIAECQAVIHCVGLVGVAIAQERPEMSFELNIRSLQVLLGVMRQNSISRLILPSAAAVYGVPEKLPVCEYMMPKPTNTYGCHKYIAEKLAETYSTNYGIRSTVLRIFNPFAMGGSGILNILLERASQGRIVNLYGEKQKRDLIHLADVADVFVHVLEQDSVFDILNVGTGKGRSIKEIVELVREYFPGLLVKYGGYGGTLYDSVADITKIQNRIAFCPDDSEDKLRQVIMEWKQYKGGKPIGT